MSFQYDGDVIGVKLTVAYILPAPRNFKIVFPLDLISFQPCLKTDSKMVLLMG